MKKRRRKNSYRNAFITGINGAFATVRLSRGHATVVVEGRDSDEPSVAGIGLTLPNVDQMITRLTNVRDALVRQLARKDAETLKTQLKSARTELAVFRNRA